MYAATSQVTYPSPGEEASGRKVVSILEQLDLSHLLGSGATDVTSSGVAGTYACEREGGNREGKGDAGAFGGEINARSADYCAANGPGESCEITASGPQRSGGEAGARRGTWGRLWGSGRSSGRRLRPRSSPPVSTNGQPQWAMVRDWAVILSPGEQQRIGVARVLYHRPMLAFLDESTSAVAEVMERRIYELLNQEGITVVSVGHRASLMTLHQHILSLSGPPHGQWKLSET